METGEIQITEKDDFSDRIAAIKEKKRLFHKIIAKGSVRPLICSLVAAIGVIPDFETKDMPSLSQTHKETVCYPTWTQRGISDNNRPIDMSTRFWNNWPPIIEHLSEGRATIIPLLKKYIWEIQTSTLQEILENPQTIIQQKLVETNSKWKKPLESGFLGKLTAIPILM